MEKRNLKTRSVRWLIPGLVISLLVHQPVLSQEEEEIEELSPFVVTERSSEGYRAVESTGGTRFRVPLSEIPAPIQILTEELMEDTVSYTVADAVQYSAGVRRAGSSTNDFNEEFSIRGFISSFNLRNGFRVNGVTDTANISHIEVVKGPGSVLYGAAEPGGLINIQTKRPLFTTGGSISYTYGTDNFHRVNLDHYDTVGGNENVAYRLVSSYTNAESDTFWALEKTFVAPSVEWRINDRIRVGVEYEYLNRNQNGLRKRGMVPIIRPVIDPRFERPQDVFDKELGPDFDVHRNGFKDGEQSFGSAWLDWEITDFATYRFIYQDNWAKARIFKIDGVEQPFVSDGENPIRRLRRLITEENGFGYKHDLLFNFDAGALGRHQLLVGFEKTKNSASEDERRTPNNATDPIPAANIRDLESVRIATDNFTSEELWPATFDQIDAFTSGISLVTGVEDLESFFLTDRVVLMDDRLHLLGGLRYDEIEAFSIDLEDNAREDRPSVDETTFQFGALYKLTDTIAVFGNFSESFQPNGFGADGEALEPQSGEGIDLGFKFEGDLFGKRFSGTVAYFDIDRENIPRTITLPPDFVDEVTLLSGLENSEGIDFDFVLDLLPNWQLLLNGAYMDGEVISNEDDPLLEGRQNVEAPKRQLRLFTRYTFVEGPMSGLTLGGGFHYEDSTPTESRSTRFLRTSDEAGIVDLFAAYAIPMENGDLEFRLNVDNVTDKEYLARSQQWGDAREFRLTAKYSY